MIPQSDDIVNNVLKVLITPKQITETHRPIIVKDSSTLLGKVLSGLRVYPQSEVDDVVDNDLILIWAKEKRVITGSDILGRLLRGIALRDIGQSRM